MIPFGDMLQNYYRAIAKKATQKRASRLAEIKTRKQALSEVDAAKKRLQKAFGTFPERVPLNPEIRKTFTRDGLITECIVIQVRENMHATMVVYRREDSDPSEKQPLVLQLCGHNANGKAAGNGQRLLMSLARAGFTTASIDPIGQGERLQYDLGTENPVRQHNLAGKLISLEDEFFGSWRLFEARCALDYLLSRDDIDTARVGVCGTSGGGTLSSYLFGLDERIHAAAPACYLTTFWRNFQNELPTDSEQIPPGLWADGGDMADFIIARAPAPALILEVENDFFDVRGTVDSYNEAKKIYSLLGKEDNCEMFVGPGSHCLSAELRKATFDFFVKHFMDEEKTYETIEPWPDADLYATQNGQILELQQEKSIYKWFEEKNDFLKERRDPSLENISEFLKTALKASPEDNSVPDYNISYIFNTRDDGLATTEFALETEENIVALLHIAEGNLFHFKNYETATLYVAHLDASSEMAAVTDYDGMLFALDVRGIGRSRFLGCSRREDYFDYYDSDYFADSTGKLLDTPYLGGKVRDLRKTVALMRANGCKNLTIKAHGLGALVTLFTLGIDPYLADKVHLTGLPTAYGDFTGNTDVRWPQSHMIPGMLKVFDIPDLCKALSEKTDFKADAFLDRMMN
ncbi:MAG: hypothetical protein E7045_06600 [Lentisphaerae bacterium]|nr:hypothetical protein [Lentisphaerota bacterium]